MSAWTSKKSKNIISTSEWSKGYKYDHTDEIVGHVDSECDETVVDTRCEKSGTTISLNRAIHKHYGHKTLVRNRVPRKKNGSFDRLELTYDEHIRNLKLIFERGLEQLNLNVKKDIEFSKLFTNFIYKCSSGEINI